MYILLYLVYSGIQFIIYTFNCVYCSGLVNRLLLNFRLLKKNINNNIIEDYVSRKNWIFNNLCLSIMLLNLNTTNKLVTLNNGFSSDHNRYSEKYCSLLKTIVLAMMLKKHNTTHKHTRARTRIYIT